MGRRFSWFSLLLVALSLWGCNPEIQETPQVSIEKKTNVSPTDAPSFITKAEEVRQGIEIGNEIVRAIDGYYQEKCVYPERLEDLVPGYLAEIPKTITDLDYRYIRIEPSEHTKDDPYRLSFVVKTALNMGCAYFPGSTEGTWECGPGTTH